MLVVCHLIVTADSTGSRTQEPMIIKSRTLTVTPPSHHKSSHWSNITLPDGMNTYKTRVLELYTGKDFAMTILTLFQID